MKISGEPCGPDCYLLLDEVSQDAQNGTTQGAGGSDRPNKIKKNISVDSGNEASSEDSNDSETTRDSTTRSSIPGKKSGSQSGNSSAAELIFHLSQLGTFLTVSPRVATLSGPGARSLTVQTVNIILRAGLGLSQFFSRRKFLAANTR